MKVKIVREYLDTEQNRIVKPGAEIEVTQDRAVALVGGGVAFAVDSTAELEAQIAEKDAQIAELEAQIAELEAQIAELKPAEKKK